MKVMKTIKQHGGKKLLLQMIKNKTFFVSVAEILSLGRSRTSLEIVRLSNQLKVKNKLERKYKKTIINFKKSFKQEKQEQSNIIWFCWLDGIDNAPEIVKVCRTALGNNLSSREIIDITDSNIEQYVTLPGYIMKKYRKGIITKTHFTDILRIWLLAEKGGTWIDATVFCSRSENNIPDFYFNSDLFTFQNLKPGRDGHGYYISSWFMTAKSNNKIVCLTKKLLEDYWKRENKMLDYFLLHAFFSISLEVFPDDWKKIVPVDNSMPHVILLRLFDRFDEEIWNSTVNQVPFHKLSYKFDAKKTAQTDTFYKRIIERGK